MEDLSTPYPSTWPPVSKGTESKQHPSPGHNAAMRALIAPWARTRPPPPGCQAVMASSWSRFSPGDSRSKPVDEMKTSVLWAPRGTTPGYNPPIAEWFDYLGVEKPDQVPCGRPDNQRNCRRSPRRSRSNSRSSWSTESSVSSLGLEPEPIAFKKVAVKVAARASLLTESFKSTPAAGAGLQRSVSPAVVLRGGFREETLSASMLPLAFDPDSDEDE
ncbi:uncharacterized protein BDR25DRAFT_315605 [Lindgomyces ingoldianus]|uniref:Uncharacterized protein n=1 Tax=Lindgomyces ingoldianus TaxID=673940 RepID=A0ACB6QRK3_9PLEO|nr:uncharacterized protein BDR25DRAFT_315605 [Lindgomyces ingoldianus]KAF2469150.1 hypothetical protein BDR25DRAFT_315605 [Lindgomyces ingoldianus]